MSKTLKVRHATALPLRDISALTSRTGLGGQLQLLAVGDEDFAVVRAEIDDDGDPAETFRYDLFPVLVGTEIDARDGSRFEGLACDRDSVYVPPGGGVPDPRLRRRRGGAPARRHPGSA